MNENRTIKGNDDVKATARVFHEVTNLYLVVVVDSAAVVLDLII